MPLRPPAGFISAFYDPSKTPNQPFGAVATAGWKSLSVAFTAPTQGGAAITSYKAVSTPSGITGTSTSSPVTISGLADNTAYTAVVYANNSYGPSVASAASNSATTTPMLLIFYTGATKTILRSDTLANVTSTYITEGTQTDVSWAGSSERMYKPPGQNTWVGFGTWSGTGGTKGAVANMSTTPWTFYKNYTAITTGSGGTNYVEGSVPSQYGHTVLTTTVDQGVFNITSKAETAGQPASFTSYGRTSEFARTGDYLYMWGTGGMYKYLFTSDVLSLTASNATYTTSDQDFAVAASPDNSLVIGAKGVASGDVALYIYNSSLTLLQTISTWPSLVTQLNSAEFSPNGRYILLGGRTASQNLVYVVDTQNSYAVTDMVVPTSTSSNNYIRGVAWYPDNDTYAVSGYANAKSHIGKVSSGGMTTNLYTGGQVDGSSVGVAIIPM